MAFSVTASWRSCRFDLGEDAELGQAFQLGAGAFDIGVCALLAGTMAGLVEIAAVTPASPRTRP
jgi:hypothetical protein